MAALMSGRGRRYALGQNHEMNVTPFVDVMLVLLIVFMVAAPLATTAIKLDLPPSPPLHAQLEPPTIVSIAIDGSLTVSTPFGSGVVSRPATLDSLPATLAQALGARDAGGHRVFVRADAHVRYGRFVELMNGLQGSGYYHVSLVDEATS
jgi:biopolymer transport protein ExbD